LEEPTRNCNKFLQDLSAGTKQSPVTYLKELITEVMAKGRENLKGNSGRMRRTFLKGIWGDSSIRLGPAAWKRSIKNVGRGEMPARDTTKVAEEILRSRAFTKRNGGLHVKSQILYLVQKS